jgi:hypothetical protein
MASTIHSGELVPDPVVTDSGRGSMKDSAKESSRERKDRVTFRMPRDLTAALRRLPNQTAFVERVLRESLAHLCPLCQGSGQAPGVALSVSDFKTLQIRRIGRPAAAQLKSLVRLGRELQATALELLVSDDPQAGSIALGEPRLRLPH